MEIPAPTICIDSHFGGDPLGHRNKKQRVSLLRGAQQQGRQPRWHHQPHARKSIEKKIVPIRTLAVNANNNYRSQSAPVTRLESPICFLRWSDKPIPLEVDGIVNGLPWTSPRPSEKYRIRSTSRPIFSQIPSRRWSLSAEVKEYEDQRWRISSVDGGNTSVQKRSTSEADSKHKKMCVLRIWRKKERPVGVSEDETMEPAQRLGVSRQRPFKSKLEDLATKYWKTQQTGPNCT